MAGTAGSRIIVESERVGQVEREGEILEIVESGISVRYRVRWDDGHESVLTPSGGAVRILPGEGRPTGSFEPGAGEKPQPQKTKAQKGKSKKTKAQKADAKKSGIKGKKSRKK
jgi:Domain of unknown function (DUF1918)